MKFYANWPYWFRGGILLLVLVAIVFAVLSPFSYSEPSLCAPGPDGCIGGGPIPTESYASIIFVPVGILTNHSSLDFVYPSIFLIPNAMTVSFLSYFIFGAFLGLIYGKIKNRSKFSKV